MSQRVAQSRQLVAEGYRPTRVARIAQISRQAIYKTPKRRPPSAGPGEPSESDAQIVEVAKAHHPGPNFICSDAVELETASPGPFDCIYLFNAFFLFADQGGALRAMRAVSEPGTRLALFDYVDRGGYAAWQANRETAGLRSALRIDHVRAMLPGAGWRVDETAILHEEYLRWYAAFVARIESMRQAVIDISSEGFYEFVLTRYSETLEDVRAGRLGGATFYATAV